MVYDVVSGNLVRIEERDNHGLAFAVHAFKYDVLNRIIKRTRAPQSDVGRAEFSATYNGDNQLSVWRCGEVSSEISYDADGNMTQGPIAEGEDASYAYDVRNRLLSCKGVGYVYDSSNNRSALSYTDAENRQIKYRYIYNRSAEPNEVLIRNKSVTGSGFSAESSTYYIYGMGLEYEVAIDAGGAETVRYYHSDQVGSTIALTDENCSITDRFSYDTWGYSTHDIGVSDTPFRYVGAFGVQTDPNGLINMRARYYNPTTMSFITEDPAGFSAGLNWYMYASGNPLSRVDANGFCDFNVGNMSASSIIPWTWKPSLPDYSQDNYLNAAQTVLTGLGMLPVVGTAFNVVNAGISYARGDYMGAVTNLASAIPIAGIAVGAVKLSRLGLAAAKSGYKIAGNAGNSIIKIRTSTFDLLTNIATRAEKKINGIGPLNGIKKHAYAERLLNKYQKIFDDRGLMTEINVSKNGIKARLDVYDSRKNIIYDYKFGKAVMSSKQNTKYKSLFEGVEVHTIKSLYGK